LLIFQELTAFQRQQLWRLFGAAFLFWTSIAILLPTLPIHLENGGFDQKSIGLITGAFALGLLLTRPSLGKIADTQGRTRVLILGSLVAASAPLGYLMLHDIWPLVLLRTYHGLSIAAFTTAYSALVADIAPPQQRGQLMGYMSLANPVGVAIGPAIGGFFMDSSGANNFLAIFLMSAGLGLGSLVLAASIKEQSDTGTVVTEDRSSAFDAVWQTITTRQLLIPTLVLLLVGFPFGALHTFVPLYIKNSAVALNPGWFYTAAALASFSARLFLGKATDRYGRGVFIAGSLIVYGLAMALLATAHSAMHFLLAAVLEGISVGTLMPTIVALVTDRCPIERRGRVITISIAGLDLGIAIAAPVFGLVVPQIGYSGIFGLGAGMSGLALILFSGWANPNLRSSIGFATGRAPDKFVVSI
jgi:MFS family permease